MSDVDTLMRHSTGATEEPPSTRTLILLSLLITILCGLFVLGLNYDIIFSRRPWLNFFWYSMEKYELEAAFLLTAILVALYFFPKVERLESLVAWIARTPSLTAIGITLLLSACTLVVYMNHPLSMDEYVDWFQTCLSGCLPTLHVL